jgi:hypothetical protein
MTVRAGGPADVTVNDVLSLADFSVTGASKLTRTDKGVSIEVDTTGLAPGAYTFWWIVFNHPEECVFGPGFCGFDPSDFDVGGPAGFGFIRASGHIVDESGEATVGANLKQGEMLYDNNLNPTVTLEDPRTAEIQLIVRYHGPVDPERMPGQIHTGEFDNPDVYDVQISIHPAP